MIHTHVRTAAAAAKSRQTPPITSPVYPQPPQSIQPCARARGVEFACQPHAPAMHHATTLLHRRGAVLGVMQVCPIELAAEDGAREDHGDPVDAFRGLVTTCEPTEDWNSVRSRETQSAWGELRDRVIEQLGISTRLPGSLWAQSSVRGLAQRPFDNVQDDSSSWGRSARRKHAESSSRGG